MDWSRTICLTWNQVSSCLIRLCLALPIVTVYRRDQNNQLPIARTDAYGIRHCGPLLKRHPRSNLRSPTAMWDFWVKRQGSERGTEQGESGGDGDHGAIMAGICQQSVTSAQQRLNVAHCGRAESVKRNGAGSTGR